MSEPVTDPALLAQLNGEPQPVNDPTLLALLNGGQQAEGGTTLSRIRDAIHAPTRLLENGFLFGLGDRARSAMGATIGDGSYAGNLKDERNQTEDFKAAHPIAAPVLEGVGGIAGPLGVLGAAAKGATLGGKVAYGMGTGAGVGGALGATGSEDWTNLPQTIKDSIFGAGIGAGIGGAVPAVGAGVGAGYNWLANAMRSTPGISRGAAPHLLEALKADGAPAVQSQLDRLGSEAMLADTGPAFLGKAQGASLNSDEGRSILQKALSARNEGTNQRIMGDVNRALGPAEDPQTVTNAIRQQRSAVDSQNYPAALSAAPDVQTAPILSQLEDMIPKSVGMEKKALANLRDMMTLPPKRDVASSAMPANQHARDVADIRAKYGDSAAAAFQKQNEPKPQSLNEFLATHGLGPDPELAAIGADNHIVSIEGVGRRKLVKQGGWPLDYAREAAEEAGYLNGSLNKTSTVNDLLDAMDKEMRGQKLYPMGYEGTVSKREALAMSERERHEWDQHIRGLEEDGLAAPPIIGTAPPAPLAKLPQTSAEVLHKIKGELDNVIQYDAPGLSVPAGALTRQQGALKHMRGLLNNALETQVPGYAEANAVSAALARRAEAVDAGTQYLGSGKTTPSPDRFATEFNPLAQGEKIAFAKGSRGNIDRLLGTKANDLQALRGELQGEGGWNTAKLATVHGQPAADELIGSVDRNLKFRDTFNKVVENSQTAQRTAAAKAMKPDPSSETQLINPNMTLAGIGSTAVKKTAISIANVLLARDPTKTFGEVAKVLSAQGAERDAFHRALVEALMGRQANAVTSGRVGNAAALATTAAAQQYLRDQTIARRRN